MKLTNEKIGELDTLVLKLSKNYQMLVMSKMF